MRFRKAVIDIGADCLKGNGAVVVAFGTCDFTSVQTSAYGDFYTLDAGFGNLCNLLLDRSSVRYALFKLSCNRFRNKLCVAVDFFDFFDVDYDNLALGKLFKVFVYNLDLINGLTYKQAGATRVDAYFDFVGCPDNCNFADCRVVILLF